MPAPPSKELRHATHLRPKTMTKTALNTAQPEYWQLAANWSPAGIPAATDTVVVPAGIAIQTQASDARPARWATIRAATPAPPARRSAAA